MEEILGQFFQTEISTFGSSRELLSGSLGTNDKVPKWKETLWDANSTEPAMLRVPIVISTFVLFWGINILIFDKFKLQYPSVMSIKSGKFLLSEYNV